MPEPSIVLNPDQAEDLHELLDHAETIAQWLLHAAGEIPGDLAQTAYPTHFHPRSAVFWLIEDLVHTQYRLHKTLHPDPGSHDHDPRRKHPRQAPPHRQQQPQRPLNAAGLTQQPP